MKDYYRNIVPYKVIRLELQKEEVLNSNLSDDAKEIIIDSIDKKLEELKKEENNITTKKHQ